MKSIRGSLTQVLAIALIAAAVPASGQEEKRTYRIQVLGGASRNTVISPDGRSTEVALDQAEFEVLIPGCHENEPGVFLCETVHEYQHCRTLMRAGSVYGCRAGLAFDGGFAMPAPAGPGDYSLALKSTAQIRVERAQRGEGRVKGKARFEVSFAPPIDAPNVRCLQRDRYIYYPTGPRGGLADIDDTADCGEPIEGEFMPHEDHMLQAYDMCTALSAWGDEIEQPMDVLVAALFNIGSTSPEFLAEHGAASTVIASYLTIKAPVTIDCRD